MQTRAVRIVAVATAVFSVALMLVALLDRATVARFPPATTPLLLVAAMAYAAFAAATWRLGGANEPPAVLTRYRQALLAVLAAYGVSFGPLALAALPLGAAAVVPEPLRDTRALRHVLRAFAVISALLALAAFAMAARAEEVFRQRLEGLVQLTAVGLGCWHTLACVLAASQLPALTAHVTAPTPATWQRFSVVYRRVWRIAAVGATVMVVLFLLIIALIQLERSAGPPR